MFLIAPSMSNQWRVVVVVNQAKCSPADAIILVQNFKGSKKKTRLLVRLERPPMISSPVFLLGEFLQNTFDQTNIGSEHEFSGGDEVAWVNYRRWYVKWITGTSSGSPLDLCCLWTEMVEMLFPGTFFQDVLTFKISALHHFYFQSYNIFSWWISNFSEIELFPWLSL